ncbi:MAG: hypothetical protein JRD04_07335 [Deltaproteobacteria bacterium]|nr:hypothetical protein [Deltaproteobacteria bacterium]
MKKMSEVTKRPSITAKLFLFTGTLLFLMFSVGAVHADSTQTGVVATAASDYSSYAVSAVTVDPKAGPRIAVNNLLAGSNGATVKAFGQYYYRIQQFQSDSVTKVDITAPNTPIWQFSTSDAGETDSSNPYDLVFVSSTKAYLIRYGSTKAWIINPSATTEAGFKIGELDLSAYADAGGAPEMCCAVIANNKLFIVMQRLVDWCPTEIAYIAVFDTTTDTEIDTGMGSGSMIGIPLTVKNPSSIQYIAQNNRVYVQGVGSWPGGSCDPVYEYTGGIESINPITYASAIVLDDGDATTHPYGAISGMLIASPTKGYFVGYAGWGDNTLYAFNPTTGEVSGALSGFQNINISGMNSGTYLDKNDMMWVCDSTNAVVKIVDTADNTLNENIATNLNPQAVAFCTRGVPLAPTLGSTVSGNNVMAHWDTVSGAEGYYLWISEPASSWTALYDWKTRTSVSAMVPAGSSFYVSVIPYNAEGLTGAASNVAHIETAAE